MRSKNAKRITAAESEHMGLVKDGPCAVCSEAGPSIAHHIEQGLHYCTVALCEQCHVGKGGIHGDKTLWRIFKMDEIKALNETLRRVYA